MSGCCNRQPEAGEDNNARLPRVAIVWPGLTGYMGACWRALAERATVKIWLEPSYYEQHFDGADLAGLDWQRLEPADFPRALEELREFAPDLTLVCGWRTPLCRLAGRTPLGGKKVIAFDMPWEWRLRKIMAKVALWPYLRHFDGAFVPGRSTAKYGRWLGFGGRLVLGSNTSGWERFQAISPAERGFLFVGRLVEEKGIDTLLAAYARYRQQVADPWPLEIVGVGPLTVPEAPGVRLRGFVPPQEMPQVMGQAACLVLPSRWEPWGVCAAEAMCAGLCTILSRVCGLTYDAAPTRLIRPNDVRGLTEALLAIDRMTPAERTAERLRARAAMKPYAATCWAEHLLTFLRGAR